MYVLSVYNYIKLRIRNKFINIYILCVYNYKCMKLCVKNKSIHKYINLMRLQIFITFKHLLHIQQSELLTRSLTIDIASRAYTQRNLFEILLNQPEIRL